MLRCLMLVSPSVSQLPPPQCLFPKQVLFGGQSVLLLCAVLSIQRGPFVLFSHLCSNEL